MMYSKDYNIRFNMNADPMVQIYNVDLMDNQLKLVSVMGLPPILGLWLSFTCFK